MKSIGSTLGAAIALVWCSAPAIADEASKNAKIEEMLVLMHVDRISTQMLDQMKTQLTAQLSKVDMPAEARQTSNEMQQKIMSLVADRLSWEKAEPAYVKIYAETFTENEVDGILAFYKSPAGKSMLDKTPVLMQKSVAVGQRLMGDALPEIQRMIEESKPKPGKN